MNPPPHYSGTGPPRKKGLPPLAWAGIGCGGLILLAVIAGGMLVGTCAKKGIQFASELAANPGKEAAGQMVTEHPGIERVSEDPKAGTMEIRLKGSGETVTLGYAELGQGRIPFKDASGNLLPDVPGDLARIPAWVPRYPATREERLIFHDEVPQRIAGMVTSQTTDSSETVSKFFEDEAARLSFDASGSSSMNINGNSSFKLAFREGKRELVVIGFGKSGEPLTIQTTYKETK